MLKKRVQSEAESQVSAVTQIFPEARAHCSSLQLKKLLRCLEARTHLWGHSEQEKSCVQDLIILPCLTAEPSFFESFIFRLCSAILGFFFFFRVCVFKNLFRELTERKKSRYNQFKTLIVPGSYSKNHRALQLVSRTVLWTSAKWVLCKTPVNFSGRDNKNSKYLEASHPTECDVRQELIALWFSKVVWSSKFYLLYKYHSPLLSLYHLQLWRAKWNHYIFPAECN